MHDCVTLDATTNLFVHFGGNCVKLGILHNMEELCLLHRLQYGKGQFSILISFHSRDFFNSILFSLAL